MISRIRELCKSLAKEVSPEDIAYIETVLGMNFHDALDKSPVALFLLLLEAYVGYVQHLVMIHDINKMFEIFKIEDGPVFLSNNGKLLSVSGFVRDYSIDEISVIYRKLFVSDDGKKVLRELISLVKDPRLRNRFQRLFLGGPYERSSKPVA